MPYAPEGATGIEEEKEGESFDTIRYSPSY
jgi:hypothetical protein